MTEKVYLRPMERKDRRRLVMPEDQRLKQKCEELRYAVEHPNERGEILFNGQVFQPKDPTAWMAFDFEGVRVGYRVVPCSPFEIEHYFDRICFFETPGYRLHELSVKQLVAIKQAVMNAFLEPQMGPVHEKMSDNNERYFCWQRFQVGFWKAGNPNIVKTLTGVDVNDKGIIIQ